MREMIKKIVMELLPELAGGLHLDRYARVLAAGAAPPADAPSGTGRLARCARARSG